MTKTVRIENADTGKYKVKVLVQEKEFDYDKKEFTNNWKTLKEVPLDYPTAMLTEYITSTQRLIVEENGV